MCCTLLYQAVVVFLIFLTSFLLHPPLMPSTLSPIPWEGTHASSQFAIFPILGPSVFQNFPS